MGGSHAGDMDTQGILPIGTFARLCRLSVKRLRHYDELGPLAPTRVDPHTGYRYYRPDQVRDATAIGLLRSIDVPLAAIGEVLSGTDVGRALRNVRDQMEAVLARRPAGTGGDRTDPVGRHAAR